MHEGATGRVSMKKNFLFSKVRSPQLRYHHLVSLLVLSGACSGGAGAGIDDDGDAQGTSPPEAAAATHDHPLARSSPTSALAASAEIERLATQLPGRNLVENPPRVVSAEVVASAEGDEPLLRLTFAEQLPPALDFLFDGVVRHLHDDGRDGDAVANDGAFTARVPKNFESSLRGDVPSEQLAGLLPETVSRTTLANTIPYPPWSLLVTDLAVVNDKDRTSDPCRDIVSPAATGMEWSFGYLMGHMTNWGGTGYKSASDFAKAWLSAWSTAITINGDPVTAPKILPPDFR